MDIQRILLIAVLAVLLAAPAWAAEVDGFQPACGAPGDAVLVRGSDFADEPVVLFGTLTAEILRSRDDAIVCRVPDAATVGTVTISVDGTDAASDFEVVAAGSPVVHGLSTDTGPATLPVYVHGRRLGDCQVAFVDASDATQATVDLHGGRRAACFRVPEDLEVGAYTLVFTNEDGQATGACSPAFQVVEAGDATLTAIDPDAAAPGARIVCTGTDLGPPGPCFVVWTNSDGEAMTWFGHSNGYDEVKTSVPFLLAPSSTHDVRIETRGGGTTEALSYTLGEPPAPTIEALRPDAGPAGSLFAIHGAGLHVYGEETTVTMSDGTDTVEILVLFRHQGALLAKVPTELVDGDYDVVVTVGAQVSESATFHVGPLPLAVTQMRPNRQGETGTTHPVWIEGTGFGSTGASPDLQVVWDDGTDTYEGDVLFRSDRKLVVLPPGGEDDPLPLGAYTVRVVLDPGGDAEESVDAGAYTVE